MSKFHTQKLDILLAWHEIPTLYDTGTFRVFDLLKRSKRYGLNITWISYQGTGRAGKYKNVLLEHCKRVEIVRRPIQQHIMRHMRHKILMTLKGILLSPRLFWDGIVPADFYSKEMWRKTRELLSQQEFDIIYCSRRMIPYVVNENLPKVLEIEDPVLYSSYQLYLKEKRLSKKIWWLLRHRQFKIFEVPNYIKFDACVFVSSIHRELLEPYLPKNIFVIPYGVDLDYFKQINANEDSPSLIFTARLGYPFNVSAICSFYNETYPLIRKRIPNTKLYIVGREPSKEVLELASDKSVTVTGFVEDVRPYFCKASVVIVPMVIDDGGFKLKILEAMAMSKPIVSTSIGAKGIDAMPERDIVIADEPKEFADRVVELLNDEPLRRKIGSNARKLVEEKYSWETMTDKLAGVFKEIVMNQQKKSGD